MARVACWLAVLVAAIAVSCSSVLPSPPASRTLASEAPRTDSQTGPALVAVTLDVPAALRTGPFARPQTLNVASGFRVQVFAGGLAGPRLLAFDEHGVLHSTLTRAGAIVALPDRDGDGVADGVVTVHDGLDLPHGLAFRDGWLYVAETGRVIRLAGSADSLARPRRELVVDGLPSGGGHFTRTLGFGPDGGMYVSVGSSCNVCNEGDARRAALVRYDADGRGERLFARGLRNAVGFAWRPGTDELWATNNGRDWLGDDLPPETVNLVHDGDDFGWPRCHNGRLVDPEFGGDGACAGVAGPRAELQAHAAPLGLTFYPNADSIVVALHGSWNRGVPARPRLARVLLAPDGGSSVEDFVTGWQVAAGEASRWGRPVDVAVGPDGSLYVSDDLAGTIYRIVR